MEEETAPTISLHWSDLAEVTVVPRESLPEEPPRIVSNLAEVGPRNESN